MRIAPACSLCKSTMKRVPKASVFVCYTCDRGQCPVCGARPLPTATVCRMCGGTLPAFKSRP